MWHRRPSGFSLRRLLLEVSLIMKERKVDSNTRSMNSKRLPAVVAVSRQSAFTLVELLVGLILTIFISAVAITYMVSSSQTFRVQTADSLSHENARYALEILSQNVRLAGLNDLQGGDVQLPSNLIYIGTGCPTDENVSIAAGAGVVRCSADDLSAAAGPVTSDRLAIEYVANTNMTGCNGDAIVASEANPQRLANVFWTADLDGDSVRSLYCQTINTTANPDAPVVAGPALPIIDGVDSMQVQYGTVLSDETNPSRVIQRYQSFTTLIDDSALILEAVQNIKAIRIALLVNGGLADDGDSQLELSENRSYELLDVDIDFTADQVLRQVYSTTIALPNAL